jgi:hypothetical protein
MGITSQDSRFKIQDIPQKFAALKLRIEPKNLRICAPTFSVHKRLLLIQKDRRKIASPATEKRGADKADWVS